MIDIDHYKADRRRHPGKSWGMMLLALPGTAVSVWNAMWISAPLFGETPTEQQHATSAVAVLSAAPLWLVAGVCSVIVSRGVVVPVLCTLAAIGITVAHQSGSPVPLGLADHSAWFTAWRVPTSWVIVIWAGWVLIAGLVRRFARPQSGGSSSNAG